MKPAAPVHALKRKAKLLARSSGIPLHAALDRIAAEEGFTSWSLLAATIASTISSRRILARLHHGDLVLLGARPGQGKTLLGLELAAEAAKAGHRAVFFTLEYTRKDIAGRLEAIGVDPDRLGGRCTFDVSDRISADYIMHALADAPRGTVAVIDYLQILDQRRENADLGSQVRALKSFAARRGVTFVLLSQIDRSYDPAHKPCPGLADVRLPNPLDLALFDKACFLNAGKMRFEEAA